MELHEKDEYGRFSTSETTETAFFTREQLVSLIDDIEKQLVRKKAILTMIDTGEVGTIL